MSIIFIIKSLLFLSICFVLIPQYIDCEDIDEFDDVESEVLDGVEDVELQNEPLKVRREKPVYSTPSINGNIYFSDTFDSDIEFQKRWIQSQSKKDGIEETTSKYDGLWSIEEPADNALLNDKYLVLKSKAKHHAISAKLMKDFDFTDHPLVVQYEVKFQEGQECGGGYIKLLSKMDELNLKEFNDKTHYTIMFGPDKCGNDYKLHFIFRHKNPKTMEIEEKHAKKPSSNLDNYFNDKKTHLYTLVLNTDNTFAIYVDQVQVNYGSLLEDMTPAVNPPAEIVDPNDKKPNDWDEREKIRDSDAKKPDDWDESEPEMIDDMDSMKPDGWLDDEPQLVPDPTAEKPSDWDEDMDGEWEAPMINNIRCESVPGCGKWKRPQIKNVKYKGIWSAPMIDNPDYKGKWIPKMIANPNYFEDNNPFKMTSISAIGFELWSMSSNIAFDNIIITDNKRTADDWSTQTWKLKQAEESISNDGGVMQSIYEATNERPWLWAVIVVVVVLPIVLLIAYCCSSSKEDGQHGKKTDQQSTEEEEMQEEEDELVDEQQEASSTHSTDESTTRRRTKADLEDKSANNASPGKPKKKTQRDE